MTNTIARKTVEESELFPEVEPLSTSERCDKDPTASEQAFTRFRKGSGVLSLCGHHTALHEADLIGQGWSMEIDDRWKINAKPGS